MAPPTKRTRSSNTTTAAPTSGMVDIDDLAGITGLKPSTLRMYAYKGVIPSIKANGEYRFDPKAVGAALSQKGNRAAAQARPSPAEREDTHDDYVDEMSLRLRQHAILLWDKHVKDLGWAVAQVTNVESADNFIELITDAGATQPAILSKLIDEMVAGKLFVLEPGAVAQMLMCQLAATEDAPQEAIDGLAQAVHAIAGWRRSVKSKTSH
jgi:hypothetical protein